MSNMGARVARMFKNFNLENRAHREINKAKPTPAPRHTTTPLNSPEQSVAAGEAEETIHAKNDPLLSLLKTVYVESTDPVDKTASALVESTEVNRRPLKFSLPSDPYGICTITDVPKGKLSIVEALTLLNNHKQAPQTWTPEKLAEEYSLDLKDTKALLDFFVPFEIKIIPLKTKENKQIQDS